MLLLLGIYTQTNSTAKNKSEKEMSEQIQEKRTKIQTIQDMKKKIAEDMEKSSRYVKLKNGESKVFYFSREMKHMEKESPFKAGTITRKYEFEVTDTESQQKTIFFIHANPVPTTREPVNETNQHLLTLCHPALIVQWLILPPVNVMMVLRHCSSVLKI